MPRFLSVLIFVLYVYDIAAQQDEATPSKLEDGLVTPNNEERLRNYLRIARTYRTSSPVRPDSVIRYAYNAYVLSQNLHLKKEQGEAAILYADGLMQKGIPGRGHAYYRIAMETGREQKDMGLEAAGIRGIGQALWYQGKFGQAIDTIVLSINHFRQLGKMTAISDATVIISSIYGDQGNYEKAFEAAQQALELSRQYDDPTNIILSLVQIGKLYRSIGDTATAMEYYRKGYRLNPSIGMWTYRHLAHNMGDLYLDRRLYDSALYYYRQSFSGNPQSLVSRLRMGQYYLSRADYDSAFSYFHSLYTELENSGEGHILYYAMLGLGRVYFEKKDFTRALWFCREVVTMARITQARLVNQDACFLLSNIYTRVQQPSMALSFYREFVQLKDSIVNDQFKGRLFEFRRIIEDEKKIAQIELLKKEKMLSEQQLMNNRVLQNILLAGILILALLSGIVVWIIMLKRRNEKLKNESSRIEWERLATDLEMQALRAQMNPHFIFNCLSSINKFILKNDPDRASDYLTRFSRLIRLVLINSQKALISLEDEIEMLRLYLQMEQLRFRNHFNFSIVYTNEIMPGNIMVPPLLLQPFCENAIWHGLMHKEGAGHLSVTFAIVDDVLQCTITDDGIGRMKAAEKRREAGIEHQSLGLKLTAERLALFNEDNGLGRSWIIEDLENVAGESAGTRVILKIRQREWIEENK